jgi:hypothetical protein
MALSISLRPEMKFFSSWETTFLGSRPQAQSSFGERPKLLARAADPVQRLPLAFAAARMSHLHI